MGKNNRKTLLSQWKRIDWGRQDVILAAKYGVSKAWIGQMRRRFGKPLAPEHDQLTPQGLRNLHQFTREDQTRGRHNRKQAYRAYLVIAEYLGKAGNPRLAVEWATAAIEIACRFGEREVAERMRQGFLGVQHGIE